MATLKPELRQILDRYGIDPRDKSQIWDCHGTLVLYHKAYEVIAAKEGITFDPPVVIEGNSERKVVALLVVGRMGDRTEWSIGEAAPGNCKNTYPYAMAEKRGKDRVVAKLVGLAQHVYSEDEADDFKDGDRKAVAEAATPTEVPEDTRAAAYRIKDAIDKAETLESLNAIMKAQGRTLEAIKTASQPAYESLMDRAEKRRMAFAQAPAQRMAS